MLKRFYDERINKELEKLNASLYFLIILLSVLLMLIKYFFITKNIYFFLLEIISIVASLGYIIVRSIIGSIPLFKSDDNVIKELQRRFRAHGMAISFFTYIIGEFLLMAFFPEYTSITVLYFPVWMIPAIIITIYTVKKGLLILGSKKREKMALSKLRKNTFLGSLFFGIFCGWDYLWENGSFQAVGILWCLGLAIGWGIPFYFIMKYLLIKSEKNADKILTSSKETDR
jgi:hypothetical protein